MTQLGVSLDLLGQGLEDGVELLPDTCAHERLGDHPANSVASVVGVHALSSATLGAGAIVQTGAWLVPTDGSPRRGQRCTVS